jgi:CheY-like chemotaxis protein
MFATMLRLEGHEVDYALDGHAGIELARRMRPDFVICDLGLPGVDGYEVARRLRDRDGDRHRTLVAVTGYGQDHDVRRALDAGFDRHLVKPVSLAVAREIVEGTAARGPATGDQDRS